MEPPVDVEESAVASCCCCCDALFGTDDQDKFAYTLNCAHSICAHCLEAADPEGRLVRWERLVRCPALGCPMQSPTLCRNTVLEELGDIAAGKREKLTVSMRGPIRECARPTHSGLLEDLFCLECSITVCAKCALLDHKTHTVVDIGDTSALQPGVLSFFQRAKHFSDAARVNEEHAAASSVLLAAARKRIEAFLDKSKSDIIERVESRFKQLFALADKELSRCDKAVKCLKDEQHIFGAQLAASAHICEAALRSNSNVELTSALRSAAMMERIVQPYAGIAATLEMDVVIDQTKLLDALACLGDLACVPVDQSASEIIKGVPVAVVEEVPPAGGAGNEGAALPAAADVAAMDAVDGTKVTLIPRDANRNTVHLQASEVSLTVCDAEGRCVGSSHVHIGQDGRVHFTVRCPAPVVEPPVLTLYVRGEALDRWISQTSVS